MICSRELAERLKEAGFDMEVCCSLWKGSVCYEPPRNHNEPEKKTLSLPTLSEAAQWLREKKGFWIVVQPPDFPGDSVVLAVANYGGGILTFIVLEKVKHKNYNEALTAGIEAALAHLQNKMETGNGANT